MANDVIESQEVATAIIGEHGAVIPADADGIEDTILGICVDPENGGQLESMGTLTLRYSLRWWKDNIGSIIDHKWESYCEVSGYVTDAAGNIQHWKHIEVGFTKGCGGQYPGCDTAARCTDRDNFVATGTIRPRVDHWSGWVECRNDSGCFIFPWRTSNCG